MVFSKLIIYGQGGKAGEPGKASMVTRRADQKSTIHRNRISGRLAIDMAFTHVQATWQDSP